jgi:hypothetical protein
MQQLHDEIAEAQRREGVRVIEPPHPLGFLDPNLPWKHVAGASTKDASSEKRSTKRDLTQPRI